MDDAWGYYTPMTRHAKPIPWLPVDSRLLGSLFSFGHVRGVARMFLEAEIVLSVGVVGGAVAVALMTLFSQ